MRRQDKPTRAARVPTVAELNANFEEVMKLDWVAIDRQINKDTGTWKRVQELFGIPRPPETRQKISAALMGHGVSEVTRRKISASLREFHKNRKQALAAGRVAPASSPAALRVASTTWPRSIQAHSALLRLPPPDGPAPA